MTLQMSQFGQYLVSRQDAQEILQAVDTNGVVTTLDFGGVEVANHGFADALLKGLASKCSSLAQIKWVGANDYIENSLKAGLATAHKSL
jgi:STAS-like domain of unknown function (DUF4325)